MIYTKRIIIRIAAVGVLSINLLPTLAYGEVASGQLQQPNETKVIGAEDLCELDPSNKSNSNNGSNLKDIATARADSVTELPTTDSWVAKELDYNEPFIKAVEKALKKDRSVITLEDLQQIKKIDTTQASSIPEKISDFTGLEDLNISGGTISEFPDSIYELRGNLQSIDLRENHFVRLPEGILDTNWPNARTAGKQLNIVITGNQIVTDISPDHPQQGMFAFNSGHNLLEYYNVPDYHANFQDQLTYRGETPTLHVPVGYDFKQQEPDITGLVTYDSKNFKYNDLFAGHEFEFYDDGSYSKIMTNGVTTAVGKGSIYVKSKFSTPTNPYAKTRVTVIVEQSATVTVRYQDNHGQDILERETISGLVGENYHTEPKVISGYRLQEVVGQTDGQYSETPQEVTYVYTQIPIEAGDVTVYYETVTGENLTTSITLSGNVGDDYHSEERIFDGYHFKEIQGSATGKFQSEAQTIRYIYEENPIQGGNVTVSYQDMAGNEISAPKILSGVVGSRYQSSEEKIVGYRLTDIQGTPNGTFTTEKQTVIYRYAKVAGTPVETPKSPSTKPNQPSVKPLPKKDVTKRQQVSVSAKQSKQSSGPIAQNLPQTDGTTSKASVFLGISLIIGSCLWLSREKKQRRDVSGVE